MLVGCPKCRARYRISAGKSDSEEIVLRCNKCRCIFRVPAKAYAPEAVASAAGFAPENGSRIKVLVANESPAFCRAVGNVLATEPLLDVFTYNDGKSALAAIEEMLPDVVVLDVALPNMYGFEVCEAIRKNPATAAIKVILIAAIYDKTRYKREPLSLYGADDYIEKHHIPDSLAAKIYQLVYGRPKDDPAAEAVAETDGDAEKDCRITQRELSAHEIAEQENNRLEIMLDEQRETGITANPQESEAHDKARRLARLIVSDIALYNQELVEEGVLKGSFYELLADDIREGMALYERRVSADVRNGTSYMEDAFTQLITKKSRELNL